MSDLVNLTIDGKAVAVPRGTNLIEAAKQAGIEIPHYCYHPRLPVAGNCRMCLVEVGQPKLGPDRKPEFGPGGKPVIVFAPKLTIGCNTLATEGLVVNTRSPKVIKAREGVMEFLLINHPLDCPICDQAGECRLQEFAVEYGRGASRFDEEKEHKPKRVPLGPKIMLDDERCILCARCVSFMRNVAGQDCLGFVQRGSRTVLTAYPGREPNTNYDLNIVDLCPVGALTSTDFRFRQRVWFLKETRSICPHCATGCNTVISTRENIVYRQTPRDNEAVNQSWMCDFGRLNYRFINSPERLAAATVRTLADAQAARTSRANAVAEIAQAMKAIRLAGHGLAVIGSARATTEELFLLQRFAREALGAERMDVVVRPGSADGFLLQADRNPNSAGAQLTGVSAPTPGSTLGDIARDIESGRTRALFVLGENVARNGISEEVLARLDFLAVIDVLPSPVTRLAHVVIPGLTPAEKFGTFINAKGRIQRFRPALQIEGDVVPEWQTLAALLAAAGMASYATYDEVFADMARTIPQLNGLTWSGIGDQGLQLEPLSQPAAEGAP